MIRAIALDDEPLALDIIREFCTKAVDIELVKTFTSASQAREYLSQFPIDLLFLDINMPSISGLHFKQLIDPNTLVIFTTAHSDFALEGFNLNAVDYLLKPFSIERFHWAVEKAKAYYQVLHQSAASKPDYMLVRADYALAKVAFADILYIEGLNDYLKIHLSDQRPIVSRMTMKAMTQKLPAQDFVRVHRSYIVPLAKIDAVRNKVVFIGDIQIPIGISYEQKFFDVFTK